MHVKMRSEEDERKLKSQKYVMDLIWRMSYSYFTVWKSVTKVLDQTCVSNLWRRVVATTEEARAAGTMDGRWQRRSSARARDDSMAEGADGESTRCYGQEGNAANRKAAEGLSKRKRILCRLAENGAIRCY
ncbi:hypothetical protein U1Q18_034590 [Sarracenia purpurea var. burkii]